MLFYTDQEAKTPVPDQPTATLRSKGSIVDGVIRLPQADVDAAGVKAVAIGQQNGVIQK